MFDFQKAKKKEIKTILGKAFLAGTYLPYLKYGNLVKSWIKKKFKTNFMT